MIIVVAHGRHSRPPPWRPSSHWTTLVSVCWRTGDERWPTQVLQLGIHFLTISETLVFLGRLLDAIW